LGYAMSHRDVPAMILGRTFLVAGIVLGAIYSGLIAAMLGYIFSAVTLALYRYHIVNRHLFPVRYLWHKETFVGLVKKGSRIGIGTIFGMISARSDVLLLGGMRTSTEVGFYGAAHRVESGIIQGASALAIALFPGLTKAIKEKKKTLGTQAFVLFPILIAAGSVVLALFAAEWIIELLYGNEFGPSVAVLKVLLYTSALASAHEFLSKYLVASDQEKVLPYAKGGAAILNVSVNLVLIPLWGALGAAVATLFSELFAVGFFLIVVLMMKRKRRLIDPTS